PNNRWVVTAGSETEDRDRDDARTARVWETATGHPVATLLGHPVAGSRPVFGPKSDQLLTSSPYGQVCLWELKPQGGIEAKLFPRKVEAVTGTWLDRAGEIRQLNAAKWKEAQNELKPAGPGRQVGSQTP